MVDSAPKDQGRSVTHLLEPYDSYLCEKIDFYMFGGDRIFFSILCQDGKYFWVAPILESV